MLTKLRIRNFRGITTGEIGDLARLNMLVGANNSGKSTILDAMCLGYCSDPANMVHRLAARRTRRSDLALSYLTPFGADASGEIECTAEGVTILTKFTSSRSEADRSFETHRSVKTATNSGWISPGVEIVTPDLVPAYGDERLSAESVFNRVADQGTEAVRRLEQLVQRAYPEVSRVFPRTNGGSSGQVPYISLVVEKGSIPIHVAGDGLQRLFRIACVAATLPGGLLLLEEPECYLHPASLKLLAQLLTQTALSTQIVVATHSIELMDRIFEASRIGGSASDVMVHVTQMHGGILSTTPISGEDAERARSSVELELR